METSIKKLNKALKWIIDTPYVVCQKPTIQKRLGNTRD